MARIDALPTTVLPSEDHVFPAMKDGTTVRLRVAQIREALSLDFPNLYSEGNVDSIPVQSGLIVVTGLAGMPTNGAYVIETMPNADGSAAHQYAYSIGSNTGHEPVYKRVRASGTWSNWQLVLGTESLLNERYVRRDGPLGDYADVYEGDINALTQNGTWLIAETHGGASKPIANGTFIIENKMNYNGTWGMQYAYAYTQMGDNSLNAWRRMRKNSVWEGWFPIAETTAELSGYASQMLDGGVYIALADQNTVQVQPAHNGRLVVGGVSRPVRGANLVKGLFAAGGAINYIYAYWGADQMEYDVTTTGYVMDAGTGRPVKNGNASRTLIGAVQMNTADLLFYDAPSLRLLINWWNRKKKAISIFANGATAAQADANMPSVGYFLMWPGDQATFVNSGYVTTNALDHVFTSIRINSNLGSTFASKCTVGEYKGAGGVNSFTAPSIGAHAIAATLRTTGAATATISSYVVGETWG